MRFILASQSPARLVTLRNAGIEPTVIVSHVDEDPILESLRLPDGSHDPAPTVLELARAKALSVAQLISDEPARLEGKPAVVLGCDSMLEIDGEIVGKPHSPEVAVARWQKMRGKSAVLHTGHWMMLLAPAGTAIESVGDTSSTIVNFAEVTDHEIRAYVATQEPLHVAGAFTIDGLGGAFVESIQGDHHGVVGLSLPLARKLAQTLNIQWTEFWNQ